MTTQKEYLKQIKENYQEGMLGKFYFWLKKKKQKRRSKK